MSSCYDRAAAATLMPGSGAGSTMREKLLTDCRTMPSERLDLRQMEAFAAVMSAGSMTGAARLLGCSQSAVTRLIQELEAVLGYKLLHRSGPRITPTEQGLQFIPDAERLLQCLRRTAESARAIGDMAPHPLEIAASPALSLGLVPAALASLEPQLMPRSVEITVLTSKLVVREVVTRTADLGLASLPYVEAGTERHWVGQAPCVAVMAEGDKLAQRRKVRLVDLRDRRLLESASPLSERLNEALLLAGVEPAGIVRPNTAAATAALARTGLGVAVIDPATAYGLPLAGLAVRPLDVAIPYVFGAFTRAGKPMTPTLAALVEALLAKARSLIPGFVHLSDRGEMPERTAPGLTGAVA